MADSHRRRVGFDAEQRVLRHLSTHGLKPVTQNFRTRRGEIDLIMLDGDCLVFVEVRFRAGGSFVAARYTVDNRKQRKLQSAAMMFLARNAMFRHHTCRFDVVGVDRDNDGHVTIDWLKDAFRPSG